MVYLKIYLLLIEISNFTNGTIQFLVQQPVLFVGKIEMLYYFKLLPDCFKINIKYKIFCFDIK